jgi:hypothetical protein
MQISIAFDLPPEKLLAIIALLQEDGHEVRQKSVKIEADDPKEMRELLLQQAPSTTPLPAPEPPVQDQSILPPSPPPTEPFSATQEQMQATTDITALAHVPLPPPPPGVIRFTHNPDTHTINTDTHTINTDTTTQTIDTTQPATTKTLDDIRALIVTLPPHKRVQIMQNMLNTYRAQKLSDIQPQDVDAAFNHLQMAAAFPNP